MIYYYLIALVVIVIDQFTKWLIVQNLDLREVIEIIPGFLNITSHRNSGAAWGVLEGRMWFFYLITLLVIVVLIYFLQRYGKNSKLLGISLALVLGGAIGNFIDRLLHQEVVDFVQTIWGNYYFPIFNVADASLTVGVILLIVYVFLDDRKTKGTKK